GAGAVRRVPRRAGQQRTRRAAGRRTRVRGLRAHELATHERTGSRVRGARGWCVRTGASASDDRSPSRTRCHRARLAALRSLVGQLPRRRRRHVEKRGHGGKMKVLVTGTDGYLGTLLAPALMERGHEVTGVDTGFYKEGWLYHGPDKAPFTIVKDLRRLSVDDLRGHDAVVHMAELSNDPAGALA